MKKIVVSIDEKPLFILEIDEKTTVGDIISTSNEAIKQKGLNPDNYNLQLKIDEQNEISNDVLKNPKYFKVSPYNQLSQDLDKPSFLNYTSHAFSNLNKDALAILFSQMDPVSINNFCTSSKSLLQLCEEESFWRKIAIQKYGVSVNKSPYPTWKSYILDTFSLESNLSVSIQLKTDNFPSLNGKFVQITRYTPLRLFIERIIGNKKITVVFLDEDVFKYNYYDLDSFPDTIIKNYVLNLEILPINLNTTQPFPYSLPKTLDYFNDYRRYTEKGIKKDSSYLPKFVLIRPYFKGISQNIIKGIKGINGMISGLCLIGVEFRINKLPKGWVKEYVFTSATLNNETNEYEVSINRKPDNHPDYIFPNYYYQEVLNSLF